MADEQPSWGELSRLILRVETDLRQDIAETRHDIRGLNFVRQDVYDADKRTLAAELHHLRREQARIEAEQKQARDSARNALRLAFTSFVAPIVVAVVLAWVLRGGL